MGVAEKIQHYQRRENRERNRDYNDDRRAPGSKEQDDHQRGQHCRDCALAQHAVDRLSDENRLVE
jgi:hypothetical protein